VPTSPLQHLTSETIKDTLSLVDRLLQSTLHMQSMVDTSRVVVSQSRETITRAAQRMRWRAFDAGSARLPDHYHFRLRERRGRE